MILSIFLKDFRNYETAFVEFSPSINVIHGKNAQGKTNLLEAIYFLATGRSFRTFRLTDLIRFGATSFHIECRFLKDGVEESLQISSDGKERKILYNQTSLSRLSDLFGILLGVVLAPNDSDLLIGPPAFRRRFLDLHIAQVNPTYLHFLTRYLKAMRYRNDLLKTRNLKTIEVWEEEMAKAAEEIMKARKETILELNELSKVTQQELGGESEVLKMEYKPSISIAHENLSDHMMRLFHELREKEMERGQTLIGPHRDDLILFLQGKRASFFASEGQKRSMIASLKLSEWLRLKEKSTKLPFICVDDVDVNLDKTREKKFYHKLSTMGQVFLTTPQESPPPEWKSICVQEGALR